MFAVVADLGSRRRCSYLGILLYVEICGLLIPLNFMCRTISALRQSCCTQRRMLSAINWWPTTVANLSP